MTTVLYKISGEKRVNFTNRRRPENSEMYCFSSSKETIIKASGKTNLEQTFIV